MAVKLTKNEQKIQKDALKQFQRYLPTLQLKKQQLQMVIRKIERECKEMEQKQKEAVEKMQGWIAVYSEQPALPDGGLKSLVKISRVVQREGNIAGVFIPVFEALEFETVSYDLDRYPLWVDKGIESLKDVARYDALVSTLRTQVDLLNRELRTTTQRVNLFEKVKIPEAKENIRRIAIYLGDQSTAAVVRGKIAKKKLVKGA